MISFLQPWLLAALPLAGLPLLLHLIARREPPTVVFPAVRYLVATTREHEHRLRLRNWLLLLLRTLLILALVLAAAGPSAAIRQGGGHVPSALVIVFDNSASAGAVVGGTARFTELRASARAILADATQSDGVWLLTADGVPRRGTPQELDRLLDSLRVSDRRMDLGEALVLAGDVLRSDSRPAGIALLTDLQASAISPAQIQVPLLVVRPGTPAPGNAGIAVLQASPQPWTPDGGVAILTVAGDSGRSLPLTVSLGDRPGRPALVTPGPPTSFTVPGVASGWWVLHARLDPDEFRADDDRVTAVRVAPVAAVGWPDSDRYLGAARDVLETNGRVRKGREVVVGSLGPAASIVMPPADPAAVGALNRALERRGTGWLFESLVEAPAVVDSGVLVGRERVLKRYRFRSLRASGDASSGVLATVGGEPWIVRGGNVVLIGSRLDPEWTSLPLSAGFMPFLDAMVNRVARGQVAVLSGAAGDPVLLPDLVTTVRSDGREWSVEGGAAFRPPSIGVYYLVAGRDTVGSLSVNVDSRESSLAEASDAAVRDLWPGARLVDPGRAGSTAFAQVGRADLQAPLLWLAFGLAVLEVGIATGWKRRA